MVRVRREDEGVGRWLSDSTTSTVIVGVGCSLDDERLRDNSSVLDGDGDADKVGVPLDREDVRDADPSDDCVTDNVGEYDPRVGDSGWEVVTETEDVADGVLEPTVIDTVRDTSAVLLTEADGVGELLSDSSFVGEGDNDDEVDMIPVGDAEGVSIEWDVVAELVASVDGESDAVADSVAVGDTESSADAETLKELVRSSVGDDVGVSEAVTFTDSDLEGSALSLLDAETDTGEEGVTVADTYSDGVRDSVWLTSCDAVGRTLSDGVGVSV